MRPIKKKENGTNRNCRLRGRSAHNHIVCAASRENHQDEGHQKHLARNVCAVLNRRARVAHLRHRNSHIACGFGQRRHSVLRKRHPDIQNQVQVTVTAGYYYNRYR